MGEVSLFTSLDASCGHSYLISDCGYNIVNFDFGISKFKSRQVRGGRAALCQALPAVRLSMNPRMLGCPSRVPKKHRRVEFSQSTTPSCFA